MRRLASQKAKKMKPVFASSIGKFDKKSEMLKIQNSTFHSLFTSLRPESESALMSSTIVTIK